MNLIRHLSTRSFIKLTISLWLTIASQHSLALLTATVDRSDISLNETFSLRVTSDKRSLMGSPDLNGLDRDFEILSQRKQSSFNSNNGVSSSSTEWVYDLSPRKAGNLSIPPIKFEGEQSAALSITVAKTAPNRSYSTQGQASVAQTEQPVFLDVRLSDKESYVQSQIILTLKVLTSITLSDISMSELNIENSRVTSLGNTQYRSKINGKDHIVYEVKYAIFPETSGTITIPSMVVDAVKGGRRSLFSDPFGGRGQRLRLRTDPIELVVKEIPDEFTGSLWLAASELNLIEEWSKPGEKFQVGDSLTRSITFRAKGLSGEQLPPTDIPVIFGVKFYPDQPVIESSEDLSGVSGIRKDAYAIIPTSPGTYTLPGLTIQWWDTDEKRMKTSTLAEKTIKVSPAAASAQPSSAAKTPVAMDYSQTSPSQLAPKVIVKESANPVWMVLSIVFAVLWLFTLGLWISERRRKAEPVTRPITQPEMLNEQQSYQSLENALKQDDLALIRQNVIKWAKVAFPQQSVRCCADLARIDNNKALGLALSQLDEALFNAGTDKPERLNTLKSELKQALDKLRKSVGGGSTKDAQNKSNTLKDLYS